MEAQCCMIGNTGFLGVPMLVVLLGPAAIGPVLGGYLVDQWSWHWAFLLNVPLFHREQIHPLAYLRDTKPTRVDDGLRALAGSVTSAADHLDLAHQLSAAVGAAIRYTNGVTESLTTAAEALALGEGVCQDHAHALIAVARERDLPARYVSGYLHSTEDGQSHDAAHAWAEIFVEGLGWVGFDAANHCCPDERYVRLASGLDAQDAAPIRGVAMGMATEKLAVAVRVEEIEQ